MKNGSPVSGGVSLDDKYLLEQGRAFMTGVQALVRLPLDRKRLDRKNGLNTAGFISGYRGSPLGGYDQQLTAVKKLVEAHDVKLWEGLNEDLGATAVWGSQQTHLFPEAKFAYLKRNPYELYLSTIKLWNSFAHKHGMQTPRRPALIEAKVLREFRIMIERYNATKAMIPAGRLVELRYVLLADAQSTPLAPLLQRLLLERTASVDPLWQRARLDGLMLGDVLLKE